MSSRASYRMLVPVLQAPPPTPPEVIDWSLVVFGKFFDIKYIRENRVKSVVRNQGIFREDFEIQKSNDAEIYLFRFQNADDRDDLLNQYTINIDGALMVFVKWYRYAVPRTMVFHKPVLWVRVKGLPDRFVREEIVAQVVSLVGDPSFVEVPNQQPLRDDQEGGSNFLRTRVKVNLKEPLLHGFFLAWEEGVCWISFTYEGVSRFCKQCGIVGHIVNECTSSTPISENDLYSRRVPCLIKHGVMRKVEQGAELLGVQYNTTNRSDLPGLPSMMKFNLITTKHFLRMLGVLDTRGRFHCFSDPQQLPSYSPMSSVKDFLSANVESDESHNYSAQQSPEEYFW